MPRARWRGMELRRRCLYMSTWRLRLRPAAGAAGAGCTRRLVRAKPVSQVSALWRRGGGPCAWYRAAAARTRSRGMCLAGVSTPYEYPAQTEVVVDGQDVAAAVDAVVAYLVKRAVVLQVRAVIARHVQPCPLLPLPHVLFVTTRVAATGACAKAEPRRRRGRRRRPVTPPVSAPGLTLYRAGIVTAALKPAPVDSDSEARRGIAVSRRAGCRRRTTAGLRLTHTVVLLLRRHTLSTRVLLAAEAAGVHMERGARALDAQRATLDASWSAPDVQLVPDTIVDPYGGAGDGTDDKSEDASASAEDGGDGGDGSGDTTASAAHASAGSNDTDASNESASFGGVARHASASGSGEGDEGQSTSASGSDEGDGGRDASTLGSDEGDGARDASASESRFDKGDEGQRTSASGSGEGDGRRGASASGSDEGGGQVHDDDGSNDDSSASSRRLLSLRASPRALAASKRQAGESVRRESRRSPGLGHSRADNGGVTVSAAVSDVPLSGRDHDANFTTGTPSSTTMDEGELVSAAWW